MATKKTLANFWVQHFRAFGGWKASKWDLICEHNFRVQALDNVGPIMNLVERVQKRDPKSFHSHKFL